MSRELPPSVLVVDDERQQRMLLPAILDQCQVTTASSGDEALEVASKRVFDVALVDQKMPGLTGVETLSRLRNLQPECVRFLVTAFIDADVLREAINQSGVYRFVPKPCDPAALRLDVRRAVEHRDLQRQVAIAERAAGVASLAADVAHDLANYMVPVQGAGWELRNGASTEEIAQTLDTASAAMTGLLEELQSVSMGKTPRYTLIPGSVHAVIGEAVDLSRAFLADRELQVDVEEHLPPVPMMHQRLVRVVTNLIRNAQQATLDGGRIAIRAQVDNANVRIVVADNGNGISPLQLPWIFERGWSDKGSSGIGLHNCKGIVAGHKGEIYAESEVGRGARFTVVLPL